MLNPEGESPLVKRIAVDTIQFDICGPLMPFGLVNFSVLELLVLWAVVALVFRSHIHLTP